MCTDIHTKATYVQMYQSEKVKRYEVERHSKFFTDAGTKAIYKAHAASLLNRVNTYSGYSLGPSSPSVD
jgi:hypothetical protein